MALISNDGPFSLFQAQASGENDLASTHADDLRLLPCISSIVGSIGEESPPSTKFCHNIPQREYIDSLFFDSSRLAETRPNASPEYSHLYAAEMSDGSLPPNQCMPAAGNIPSYLDTKLGNQTGFIPVKKASGSYGILEYSAALTAALVQRRLCSGYPGIPFGEFSPTSALFYESQVLQNTFPYSRFALGNMQDEDRDVLHGKHIADLTLANPFSEGFHGGSPAPTLISTDNNMMYSPEICKTRGDTPCIHYGLWKRVRSKKGYNHFSCELCGARWRVMTVKNRQRNSLLAIC